MVLTCLFFIFQDKTDEEVKEGEDKAEDKSPEDTAEKEADGEITEEKATGKDAKTKVKEAFDNIHMPNMPKMPKLHKPAFLKKKKTDGEAAPDAEGDAPAEGMFTSRFRIF